jgi:ribosomal-protein-alanine N-acetyltransferase
VTSLAVDEATGGSAGLLAALHAAGIGSAGPAWDAAAFAALLALPGRCALIATAADEPAGLALIGIAADEAELLTLAVLPGFRRRGIGRALVAAACARASASGATRLFLEVGEANAPARRLYAGFGFRAVGRRQRYYPGGEDALVLALGLSAPS